jgi:hypothetical protein
MDLNELSRIQDSGDTDYISAKDALRKYHEELKAIAPGKSKTFKMKAWMTKDDQIEFGDILNKKGCEVDFDGKNVTVTKLDKKVTDDSEIEGKDWKTVKPPMWRGPKGLIDQEIWIEAAKKATSDWTKSAKYSTVAAIAKNKSAKAGNPITPKGKPVKDSAGDLKKGTTYKIKVNDEVENAIFIAKTSEGDLLFLLVSEVPSLDKDEVNKIISMPLKDIENGIYKDVDPDYVEALVWYYNVEGEYKTVYGDLVTIVGVTDKVKDSAGEYSIIQHDPQIKPGIKVADFKGKRVKVVEHEKRIEDLRKKLHIEKGMKSGDMEIVKSDLLKNVKYKNTISDASGKSEYVVVRVSEGTFQKYPIIFKMKKGEPDQFIIRNMVSDQLVKEGEYVVLTKLLTEKSWAAYGKSGKTKEEAIDNSGAMTKEEEDNLRTKGYSKPSNSIKDSCSFRIEDAQDMVETEYAYENQPKASAKLPANVLKGYWKKACDKVSKNGKEKKVSLKACKQEFEKLQKETK